jgi:hypothetical protein
MPVLVAIAGRSRVGKGTCASLFTELAQAQGFTAFERQLSDNGKWHLARIWHPEISREQAVLWFDTLKPRNVKVKMESDAENDHLHLHEVPLQQFIQYGLQEGGRDIFGEHFWTDMILPKEIMIPRRPGGMPSDSEGYRPLWEEGFFDKESGLWPEARWTNLALISDLRQPNEAERVRECGGIVIEIHRPDVDDGYITGGGHITERGLPTNLVDYYLNSTGDLDYFREIATKLFDASVLPRLRGET